MRPSLDVYDSLPVKHTYSTPKDTRKKERLILERELDGLISKGRINIERKLEVLVEFDASHPSKAREGK